MSVANQHNRIGRFDLLDKIGQGTYGQVYLGHDPILSREVAIKVIRNKAGDEYEMNYYLAEGRNVARLRHPNIIGLFEAGSFNQHPYLVFEYVQGETLRNKIKKNGRLSLDNGLDLAQQITAAVGYAHTRSIMHLDLSLDNVMIDKHGDARVMDFGLSRIADDNYARTDAIVGTPRYLSPEHIGSAALTPQSEVFTLGLLMYEMFTGKPLVDSDSLHGIYDQILDAEFDLTALEKLGIPGLFISVIAKCLQKLPGARYINAKELNDEIKKVITECNSDRKELKEHGTIEFLLRKMRRNQDFPALSTNLVKINKLTADNSSASTEALANVILRDYSITNKLLKLANSSYYGNFKGTVNSVSRAISILGFNQVRIACNSLILFDNLGKKNNLPILQDSLIHSFISGLIARHLVLKLSNIDAEEAFICGMFHNLGSLLTIYYFPDEYYAINELTEEQTSISRSVAEEEILGIKLSDIGQTVAGEWKFPDKYISSMKQFELYNPEDTDGSIDEIQILRRVATVANRLAAIADHSEESVETELEDQVLVLEPLLKVNRKILINLLNAALNKYRDVSGILPVDSEKNEYLLRTRQWLENILQEIECNHAE